jgi:hypothetical protein
MNRRILHIFRNTPFGREVLMQSLYFAKRGGVTPLVYLPDQRQLLMYFKANVVTLELEKSFWKWHDTARRHASELVEAAGFKPEFLEPSSFTSGSLPVLPVDCRYMTCPRSISDLSTKISLGHIGPRVRSIIQNSTFPILIPSTVYKEWNSITVFFGGSENSLKAVQLGIDLHQASKLPLQIVTQSEKKSRGHYKEILEEGGFYNFIEEKAEEEIRWVFWDNGKFKRNLYRVPHDSLVVVGAYGHGLVSRLVFGSKAELLQTVLPNNLLIVGPHYVPVE